MNDTVTVVTGRLVKGHPMKSYPVKDTAGQPKLNKNGVPQTQISFGIAIPKAGTKSFKELPFGQEMLAIAKAAFPKEHAYPSFAYKVTDGDSTAPNKVGKVPCEQEGYPGHYVLFCSTQLAGINCYHVGKYAPHDQIQNQEDIKTGDYCMVAVTFKGNNNQANPGLYVNPVHFVRTEPGEAIVSEGSAPAAADIFAAHAPKAATPPPPPPHNPLPTRYVVNGVEYTAAALRELGWTEEQLSSVAVK